MLLVRDLDPENWPQDGERHCLLDHPVVREIFEGSPGETDHRFGGAPEHKVEDDPGAKIPLVFDADSSQHSALVDVLVGRRNVVIEGPPGTGKSQTITNLIAASLEAGKTVLFVVEKLAALEVVKVRLALAKLDPFVLELHSNKTTKKKVLEELATRKSFDGKPPSNLGHKLEQLDGYRSELGAYRDLINSVTHNALGLSLHQIMWRAERRRSALSVEDRLLNLISISDATEISAIELTRRMECLTHLGAQYRSIGAFDTDSTFWGFFPDALGPGDDIRLEQLFFSSCEWAERFVDDAAQYGAALDSGEVGATLDFAEGQLRGLRAVLVAADHEQALHLVPRLFQGDQTGARAKRILEAFSNQLGQYHALAPIVNQGFRSESSANQERLNVLRQLAGVSARLGASHRSVGDLVELCQVLRRESERLADAFRIVGDFCAKKRIPFDGDRSKLLRLVRLAQAVTEVPDELVHLQTSGLTREGCVPALEALANVQAQWTRLFDDLNNSLYVDAFPAEGALKQAILSLQQGEEWYRIFQSRWRSAVSVHKTLQRKKERLRVAHRIEQLERAVEFLHLAERRKNDPAWSLYLGFPAPADGTPLDGHLTLARWNRSMTLLLEELQAHPISPRDLTPEEARSARREFAEFGDHLSRAVSALGEIDRLLPKLAEIQGGHAIEKCMELVDRFVTAAESQAGWLQRILNVCSAHFQPSRNLRWHYRSQHHSLIAFSNKHFYHSNLIVFPSRYGQSRQLGIRAIYLADAIYDNQTNLREATRVVDAVAAHVGGDPKASLGVVTLNIKQRDLVAELLEERLRTVDGADKYREHWAKEGQPLFVKNLENVQGDERDAIIISTTFGKPPGSKAVRQSFGPIGREDGWRRLNVLFTRARQSVAIYTSLRPEDIVVDESTPRGTRILRDYLEYARTGSLMAAKDTERDPDSDFEISVIAMLEEKGYAVTPQLGVAGYRIDIAVKHPDASGSYLAAIECDGASYHSALTVRDRDRIRQEILESLGWKGRIWRVWSTDWFRSPRQETEKLLDFLDDLRKHWKPENPAGQSWIEEGAGVSTEEAVLATEIDREAVRKALLETNEEIEVSVGDLVRYVDVAKPEDVLSIQIVDTATNLKSGLISQMTPLAQALLGAEPGDEVPLHLPGAAGRLFRIVGINRIADYASVASQPAPPLST